MLLDGKVIPTQRISSDPLTFEVRMVDDNLFNVRTGGMTRASADGVLDILEATPKGASILSLSRFYEMGTAFGLYIKSMLSKKARCELASTI